MKQLEKKEATKRLNEFKSKYRIQAYPPNQELAINPFIYEGKTVAIKVGFLNMESATRGLFEFTSDSLFSSNSFVMVSDIPKGLFKAQYVVLLAGKVLGNIEFEVLGTSIYIPHLKFVGVYFCEKGEDCTLETDVVE